MKHAALMWGVVLGVALSLPASVPASPFDSSQDISPSLRTLKAMASDAVLLAFRPSVSARDRNLALGRYGLVPDLRCQNPHFVRALIHPLSVSRGLSVPSLIERMQRDAAFRYVEPDFVLVPDQAATDPNFGSQWALHNTGQSGGLADADLDAPEGWAKIPDSAPPIVVAVLDNGTDISHPDLAANVWVNPGEIAGDGLDNDGNGFIDDDKGWDFSNGDRDVLPASGDTHGTHCSGIVAMVRNNGVGGAGVAKRVRLMPLQIAGGSASFYSALANAIDYASLNGAKVMSVSYTIDSYSTTFSEAVGRAAARDVVYVNSAGNNSERVDYLRGTLRNTWSNVIFVASTTRRDVLSSFTNFGRTVDIAAPGSDIYATMPNNTYANSSGTSMAAPCAAAVIAQIRQVFPAMTARQALDRAMYSADRITAFGEAVNGGRANLNSALETDVIAPNAPTGLQATNRSASAIEIQFQASGDDSATGAATSYEIRTSANPITDANVQSAEVVYSQFGGQASGTVITTQVTGLVPGRSTHIAVRAIDNVGNCSAVASIGPIQLAPAHWLDDTEGANQWSGWTQTTAKAHSGTDSWTDSPSGNYANNANSALTQVGQVVLPSNPILRFKGILALEFYYDELLTEISLDNGTTWTQVGRFTGQDPRWQTYTCSLLPWSGQSAKLRFRLTSDNGVTYDGVYLDDISIISGSTSFLDNVEGSNAFAGTGGSWATTTSQFFSSAKSWTDSPSGNSAANSDNWLVSLTTLANPNLGDPELAWMMKSAYRTSDRFTAGFSLDQGASYVMTDRWVRSNAAWSSYSAHLPDSTPLRLGFHLDTTTGTTQDGVYLDNIAILGEPWMSGISGSLTRRFYGGAPALRPVTMEVRSPGGALLSSHELGLNASPTSTFSLMTPASGLVNLVFRAPGFLTRKVLGVSLGVGSSVNVTLPNGDCDLSGEVGPVDIDTVISHFGDQVGSPNYSVVADCDGSGEVGPVDIDIVIAEFGLQSD